MVMMMMKLDIDLFVTFLLFNIEEHVSYYK